MKKFSGFVLLALAVACNSDPTQPSDNGPADIVISALQTTLTVGASTQFTATPVDATGKTVTTATVTWDTDNPVVASVTQQGVVLAVAEGTANIIARSGSKSKSVAVNVNDDYCIHPLTMSVGQVKILSGPTAVSCIKLAATTGPTDFLVVTANATPTQDVLGSYSVGLAPDVAAAALMANPSIFSSGDLRDALQRASTQWSDRAEQNVRDQERALGQGILRSTLAPSRSRAMQPSRSVAAAVAPRVGDTLTYRVPNVNGSNLCTIFTTVQAEVKAIGTKALVVQDIAAPAGGFTATDFTDIAREFDDKIFPTDTLWFGSPTDRNNDGLIAILYTPEVNRATPAGSTGFTAGFFWGGDLFKQSEFPASSPCPQSNEQEIFYTLVPDPNGTINSNVRTTLTVRQGTRGVLAHELQHMINNGIRMFKADVSDFETPWLNEGLSHFAEEAVGRDERGFGDFQPLAYHDVNPDPALQDDYNAFFRQNMARLRTWMQRPDTASPISVKARSQLAPRGAAWMLLRYTADQYSNGNARAFFRNLVGGPEIDVPNLVARAGVPFDNIISGFLVAMYTDDTGIASLPTRYTIPSWNVRDLMTQYNGGNYPLFVTPLPGQYVTQSISGSGNYFRFTTGVAQPVQQLKMLSPSGAPVDFSGARVYLARLQ